jgi:hypothetical protein
MKTIASFILSMIIGMHFLAAQEQSVLPKNNNITWNETTHDFGKIVQNEPATMTFTFKNTGTTPLIITNAHSSCGCTVAEYTKEPVKPGDSGVVKATYNSAKVGAFTKTITVTFDGIATGELLTIKGEVELKSTN